MSTVTTPAVSPPADHGRPTVPSLTSAEILRLRSRRLVKVVLAVGFGLLLIAFGLIFRSTGEPSAAQLERANQQVAEDFQRCVDAVKADPSIMSAPDRPRTDEEFAQYCGTMDPDIYLTKSPFRWTVEYVDGTLGVALGFTVLLFVIGASAGGAEWSARTMPAVLYWEPRRVRVMAVKSLVIAVAALVIGVAAQLVWLVMSWILVATHGLSAGETFPEQYLSNAFGGAGRGVALGVLAALGGFALGNLTRNTGAALGVAFVYFAIVQTAVSALIPRWIRWLLVSNVGGFLNPGGAEVPSGVIERLPDGGESTANLLISNVRGGIVLTVAVGVCLALATALFSRRDVS